ncbi:mitochondrial splicing system protein [Mycoblastus sanguinarius]|nr:mitochondrial splicing system protein [Mycoblastus sanguinarius]
MRRTSGFCNTDKSLLGPRIVLSGYISRARLSLSRSENVFLLDTHTRKRRLEQRQKTCSIIWKRYFTLTKRDEPTIYALSTAPGRAAIAIIRISGPACLTVYHAICPGLPLPKPRYAALRTLHDPEQTSKELGVLDSGALVLYFPAPVTATGEDVLELHVHGGTAVVKAVLAAVPKAIPRDDPQVIRYAEPGEFTRRAFYNNRLDLTQVEALGDTLSAETEQQRRLAVRGTTGVLAERYETWRHKLLYARGELEALIDFSEDQHFDELPSRLCASVAEQVSQLKSHLQANIENASRGELLRNGISIALVGAPNAGKSSLLNQIVGREAAIVSSEAGTTRDVIDVNVDIGGFYCRFGDLAGLRKQPGNASKQQIGDIEREGMKRAKARALNSDVIIIVLAAELEEDPSNLSKEKHCNVPMDSEIQEVLEQCNLVTQKVVCLINKVDVFSDYAHQDSVRSSLRQNPLLKHILDVSQTPIFGISCKNAQIINPDKSDPGGIQALLDGLSKLFGRITSAVVPEYGKSIEKNSAWAESIGATERQQVLLQQCLQHLEVFLAEVNPGGKTQHNISDHEDDVDVVLAAESLRAAADCLAKITGRGEAGDVEEVLGVVFEKYDPACPIEKMDR